MTDLPDDYPLEPSPTPGDVRYARLTKLDYVGVSRVNEENPEDPTPPEAIAIELTFLFGDEETMRIVLPLASLNEYSALVMLLKANQAYLEGIQDFIGDMTPDMIAKFIEGTRQGLGLAHQLAQMILDDDTDGLLEFTTSHE